jgi:hypothetical protein
VVITCLGVPARAHITPTVVTTEEMTHEGTDDGEEQTQGKAGGVDNHTCLARFIHLMLKLWLGSKQARKRLSPVSLIWPFCASSDENKKH